MRRLAMTDKAEYQRRKDHNDAVLAAIQDWWAHDCDQRQQVGAYGEQTIRVQWENGRITIYFIEPKLTGKPYRHNLTGVRDGADA
jgi:hypothetical protein